MNLFKVIGARSRVFRALKHHELDSAHEHDVR